MRRKEAEESTPGDIIQLAECAKNTRVNGDQYFALFVLDSGQHLTSHGGPYGRCYAWACALDPNTQFEFDERVVSLFWDSPQTGTLPFDPSNCIKDPQTAECGCEFSGSGDFAVGRLDCPVGQNGQLGCGTPSLVACGFELDGVGVGTWNIAQGDRSGAVPQDPVASCWMGNDFDRDNQPVGTGDEYICMAGGGTGEGLGGVGGGGGFGGGGGGGGGFGGGSGGVVGSAEAVSVEVEGWEAVL
ncbi:small secreted protein [Neofusicoccum parvum]|uniref:Small secreted protein n=1 Tax=Neofusicoccum parvum TaxID=310453 RepID=A0ACB5SIN2_9PEZI|nr:small secreted protein [Neofusicoccum parvum]